MSKTIIMGGTGHMLHAIKTLKQNRALLKRKRTAKENDARNYHNTVTKVHFKKVAPEELQRIKENIRERANQVKRKDFLITLIFTLLGVVIFLYWTLGFYL